MTWFDKNKNTITAVVRAKDETVARKKVAKTKHFAAVEVLQVIYMPEPNVVITSVKMPE